MGATYDEAPRDAALGVGRVAGVVAPSTGRGTDALFMALLVASAAAIVGTLHYVAYVVPTEATMGIVQKIFYFHVPAAYAMYLGAAFCFAGSCGFLARGTRFWDAMARAGGEVAVGMGMMVLISGPLWAMKAWGVAWTWDPRLTTSMLSVLIYVAYVVLRSFTGNGESERKFAAALGILGAANLPIIHFSVQKWGGNHPRVISTGGGGLQDPAMKLGLGFGFLAFTLLAVLLVWARMRVDLASSRLADAEQEALELGVGED